MLLAWAKDQLVSGTVQHGSPLLFLVVWRHCVWFVLCTSSRSVFSNFVQMRLRQNQRENGVHLIRYYNCSPSAPAHFFCQRRRFDQDCPCLRQVDKVCWCRGRGTCIIMTAQQERTCSSGQMFPNAAHAMNEWMNDFIWEFPSRD